MSKLFTRLLLFFPILMLGTLLSAQVQLRITSPASIAGTYPNTHPADWGGRVEGSLEFEATVVNDGSASPQLGCQPSPAGAYTGKAVFIRRGDCEFGLKSLNAELSGAAAVIIVNNIDGAPPGMAAGSVGGQVTIPVFAITLADGNRIIEAISAGETVGITVFPSAFTFTNPYYPVAYTAVPSIANREVVDSMGIVVNNTSRSDLSNVTVKYEFINRADGTVLASDEALLLSMSAETNAPIEWDLSGSPISLADLDPGIYAFRYSAHYADDPFNEPGDYNVTLEFRVTEPEPLATWAHENGPSIFFRPGSGGDHADASIFNVPADLLEDEILTAKSVSWTSINNLTEGDITGREIIVFLAEVVASEFDNTKDIYDPSQFELRGYAEFVYTDESQRGNFMTVPLLDIDTDEIGVRLEPDTEYFVVTIYSGPNNILFHGYSQSITYPTTIPLTTTLVYTDSWVRYVDLERVVTGTSRMGVDFTTSVKPTSLEDISVKMMPNPASDYIQLQFNFETPENVTMIMTDMNGGVLRMNRYDNIMNDNIQVNLENIPAGNYIIQVNTKNGRAAEKIVVIK
jgi:hypothetical protein